MIRKHFKLICTIVLAVTLTLVLSGCGREEQDLDGKNIVTFELNGGTLELKTSSVNTKVNYAYHPGTYILDPVEIPGYKMYRQGYNFTGWYTTAECKPTDKWDFKTPFNTETLTLYAGWEKAIRFTYTVYLIYVIKISYKGRKGEKHHSHRYKHRTDTAQGLLHSRLYVGCALKSLRRLNTRGKTHKRGSRADEKRVKKYRQYLH